MSTTLRVAELEVGLIYIETLSQKRVRVANVYGSTQGGHGGRATVVYWSEAQGKFLTAEVGDHYLRPLDTSWMSDEA